MLGARRGGQRGDQPERGDCRDHHRLAVRWAPFKSLQISPNIPKVETENGYVVKEASSGRQLLLAKEDSFW